MFFYFFCLCCCLRQLIRKIRIFYLNSKAVDNVLTPAHRHYDSNKQCIITGRNFWPECDLLFTCYVIVCICSITLPSFIYSNFRVKVIICAPIVYCSIYINKIKKKKKTLFAQDANPVNNVRIYGLNPRCEKSKNILMNQKPLWTVYASSHGIPSTNHI